MGKIQFHNPYPEEKVGKSRVIQWQEVKQIAVTSISTSESFFGLYVAHPSCRSAVESVCSAAAGFVLSAAMRARTGASAHGDSE